MANYGRELRMKADIKRKRKVEKAMEFAKKMKKVQKNKAVTSSNLKIVERHVKKLDNINSNDVMSSCLSQSKLYLKILEVLYFLENINLSITSDIIKEIIKDTHIFNNIVLASCLHIIKAFSKSDIAVIQVNIWGSQNDMKVKYLINKCFNIGHHIAIIRGTNMNPSIPQCKNCWK